MDFPGNSHAEKRNVVTPKTAESSNTEEEKPKQIVEGTVTRRKKSLGNQVREIFVGSGTSFFDDLVANMIIPTIREMIISAARQAAEGFASGIESRLSPPGVRKPNTGTMFRRTNYNGVSSRPPVGNAQRSAMPTHRPRPQIRQSNTIMDIDLNSREDCDLVLMELDGKIEGYGHVTVGDLYSLVGETATSTDEEWGWTNISSAQSAALDDGRYRLLMPPPRPIDIRR